MTNADRSPIAPAVHRARARAALKGSWAIAVFVALAVHFIVPGDYYVSISFDRSFPLWVDPPRAVKEVLTQGLRLSFPVRNAICILMLATGLSLNGMLELGAVRYNLNLLDGREAGFRDLLWDFPRFRSATFQYLVRVPLTCLGPLLLIPASVLIVGWSMAPYILAEDPACSGPESLKRSWQLMRGHKLELCKLELSFLLWHILALFSYGISKRLLAPYTAAARASFYRELSREPVF